MQDVKPAETTPFEKVRAQLESTLTAQRIDDRRERTLAELRAGTSLDPAAAAATGPRGPVYVYRPRRGTPRAVTLVEYEASCAAATWIPRGSRRRNGRSWRDELLIALGMEDEARRLGLLDTPEYKEKWGFEKLRVAAHEAVGVRVRKRLPSPRPRWPPSTRPIPTGSCGRRPSTSTRWRSSCDRETPRAVVERAEAVAEQLASGDVAWASAAAAIDPTGKWARVRDLGWLTRKVFFNLGATAQAAAEGLRPGGTSALLQEGRKLMILRMDEQSAAAPLPLSEASETIRRSSRGDATGRRRRPSTPRSSPPRGS